MTAIFATAFFASSLTLAYLSSQRNEAPSSLLDDAPVAESAVDALPAGEESLPVSGLPSLDDEVVGEPLPATEEFLPAMPDETGSDAPADDGTGE